MTLEQWNKVIAVNLTGQFLCAREAVREFKRRGVVKNVSAAAGKIVCMSSVHQEIPWAGHANYAASKGGVMQMMRSLAQEVAPLAIRVNGVAPGAVRTPIIRPAWETKEAYDNLMTLIPYRRVGEPNDRRASDRTRNDGPDAPFRVSVLQKVVCHGRNEDAAAERHDRSSNVARHPEYKCDPCSKEQR
jgi:NAD(P)-dependent dehydrogenase (short-subunit alcohol dehydrogenase family)